MAKIRKAAAAKPNGEAATNEVHRLCAKIADQVDKGQWWNAMANAAELVAACQLGCRAEIDRVAKARSSRKKK